VALDRERDSTFDTASAEPEVSRLASRLLIFLARQRRRSAMKNRLVFLLAGFLLASVLPASAQSRDPFFSDFSANYDVVYHETGDTSNAGARFDLASTLKRDVPFIGPVGEVGFNHFDCCTVVSAMGGLRLRSNTDFYVLPFAQLVVGLYHCGVCDINDFALQGGGGIDFRTGSPNVRIRLQFDIRHVFDDVSSFNAERFSAGIVLPLNR
jgi:hypothetical protein